MHGKISLSTYIKQTLLQINVLKIGMADKFWCKYPIPNVCKICNAVYVLCKFGFIMDQ